VSMINPSCCLSESSPQHYHSRNDDADLLVLRRVRWSIGGHEEAQFHRGPAEFAKLLGARAFLWCLAAPIVIKTIKFIEKMDSHSE
jgi:hypothetical protein